MTSDCVPTSPRLIETAGAANIVSYLDKFWSVPLSLGAIDFSLRENQEKPGVKVFDTLDAARRRILVNQPPMFLGYYRGFNLVRLTECVYAVPWRFGRQSEHEIRLNASYAGDAQSDVEMLIDANQRIYRDSLNLQANYEAYTFSGSSVPAVFPEGLEIEPVSACNLRCKMCHVTHFSPPGSYIDIDKLLKWLEPNGDSLKDKWVILGGAYECTLHPRLPQLLSGLTSLGMKISFITNGSLLNNKLINALSKANIKQFIVSFDGMRKTTYENIRVKSDYDETLKGILAARAALSGKNTYFICNYIAMRSTLTEIPDAVEFWDNAEFNSLNIINIRTFAGIGMDDETTFTSEELSQAVGKGIQRILDERRRLSIISNSIPTWVSEKFPQYISGANTFTFAHPESAPSIFLQSHIQLGENPDLPVACVSANRWLRVFADGKLFVCNNMPVDTIGDNSLYDIWNGGKIHELRQRLKSDPSICMTCHHFKFCLTGGSFVGYEKNDQVYQHTFPKTLYKDDSYQVVKMGNIFYASPLYFGVVDLPFLSKEELKKQYVLQAESLEKLEELMELHCRSLPSAQPVHRGSFAGYNFVAYEKGIMAVPISLGKVDLDLQQNRELPGIIFAKSLEEARKLVSLTISETLYGSETYGVLQRHNRFYAVPPPYLRTVDLSALGKDELDKLFTLQAESREVLDDLIKLQGLSLPPSHRPLLLDSYAGYNFVAYEEDVLAIPISLGRVELSIREKHEQPGIIFAKSLEQARELVYRAKGRKYHLLVTLDEISSSAKRWLDNSLLNNNLYVNGIRPILARIYRRIFPSNHQL